MSGIVYRNNSNIFNSVIHIHSSNIDSLSDKDIYNKIQLVPLAEYNPFQFISGMSDELLSESIQLQILFAKSENEEIKAYEKLILEQKQKTEKK